MSPAPRTKENITRISEDLSCHTFLLTTCPLTSNAVVEFYIFLKFYQWNYVVGILWCRLILLSITSARFTSVVAWTMICSSSLLYIVLQCPNIATVFLICSVDGHLGSFQAGDMNGADVNILAMILCELCEPTYVFL